MQHNDLDALIRQISQQCGDPAAAARLKAHMQAGDTEGAKQIMQRTMQTPEGAQLAQQIARLMGR